MGYRVVDGGDGFNYKHDFPPGNIPAAVRYLPRTFLQSREKGKIVTLNFLPDSDRGNKNT